MVAHDRRSRARRVLEALPDARGRQVMLVSHCLLNQNTRYAGGATRAGAVTELVSELVAAGYGIHQLPCPERFAWGGVLKPHSLWLYHSKGGPLYPLRGVLLRVFVWWTRLVYWNLARQVVRDVADYQRSGITVAGIVGIGTSPSCGVTTTVDLRASLDILAACPAAALTREVMNEQAVLSCRRPGEGLFIEALDGRLKRRGIAVPSFEHDLATELHKGTQPLLTTPAPRTLGIRPVIDH
jgi:uncharacterized protein YbbK (DUF523 family)